MKKDLIKLILIFFISIFVIGLLPIVQFIWAFMPTKLVTKEEKQHIEYVVNTAFEDDLGLKVKKIEIPTLVSRVTYQYYVKVQLTEGADKILTDKLEDRTYSYYANSDDKPSSILTNLIFSYVLDTNSHPMLNTLYFDKESVLKPEKFKNDASADEIKKLRKDMIRLSEKYGAQLNLYLFLKGDVPEGASLSDYIDFTSLPKNVYVVVWGENGKLDSNGFQAE